MEVVIVKGSREVGKVDGLENICGKVEAIGLVSGSGWSWIIGDILDGYDDFLARAMTVSCFPDALDLCMTSLYR